MFKMHIDYFDGSVYDETNDITFLHGRLRSIFMQAKSMNPIMNVDLHRIEPTITDKRQLQKKWQK